MSDVLDDKWFLGVLLRGLFVWASFAFGCRFQYRWLVKKLASGTLFICYFPFLRDIRPSNRCKNVISKMLKTIQNIKRTKQNVHFTQYFSFFDLLAMRAVYFFSGSQSLVSFVNEYFRRQKCFAVTYFRSCSKWVFRFFFYWIKRRIIYAKCTFAE